MSVNVPVVIDGSDHLPGRAIPPGVEKLSLDLSRMAAELTKAPEKFLTSNDPAIREECQKALSILIVRAYPLLVAALESVANDLNGNARQSRVLRHV